MIAHVVTDAYEVRYLFSSFLFRACFILDSESRVHVTSIYTVRESTRNMSSTTIDNSTQQLCPAQTDGEEEILRYM